MTTRRLISWVKWGALIVVMFFFMVWVRVFSQSRAHFLNGRDREKTGDWAMAVAEYESSIQMYSPWSPWVKKSAERLWELGKRFEAEDEKEKALLAYRGLRTSFLLTRGLYTPGKDWIEKVTPRIADLVVEQLIEDDRLDQVMARSERAHQLDLLREPYAPDLFWVIILETGFLGWIGSVFLFIFKGVKKEGGLNREWALRSYVIFLACFAMWVIGLLKA